jgi:protocatechuate 3,4-dioxygenase beta subunit
MQSLRVWLVTLALSATFANTHAAVQTPAAPQKPGTGVIVGTVVDAVTNVPIGKAAVNVSADGNRTRTTVIADEEGRFVFTDVPAGSLLLGSSQTGYVNGYYGIRSPFSANQNFDLAEGEKATGVVIRMWKNATVSGTVTDANNDPVVGASVTAMRAHVVCGRTELASGVRVTTDDRGMYRLQNVTPGTYAIVMPSPANMTPTTRGFSPSGFPTVCYPDTTASENAMLLALGGGEERTGIDFHVMKLPAFTISGTVPGRMPGQSRPLRLTLRPVRSTRISTTADLRRTTADAQGQFTFPGVLPGSYVIEASDIPSEAAPAGTSSALYSQSGSGFMMTGRAGLRDGPPLAPIPKAPALWADTPVTVENKNVEGLSVALAPGAQIRGRVLFEGAAEKPDAATLASTMVLTMSADGRELGMLPASGVGTDGSFESVGLPPGAYEVMVFLNSSTWSIASVTVAGQDVTGTPLTLGSDDLNGVVLTFTDRPSQLSGVVTDDAGKPFPDATIYVFAADRRKWANTAPIGGVAREVRPSRSGAYKASLLPGEYFVVAVGATAQEGWRTIEMLDTLAKAAKTIKIAAGQTVTLNPAVAKGK